MVALTGRVVPVRSLAPAEMGAWTALAATAIEPNPLFEPACVVPAATHLEHGSTIALAVAEARGVFYGCVPVRLSRRWPPAPVAIMTTDVRRMTYLGTPLLAPTRSAEALRVLLGAIGSIRHHKGPRLLELRWVNAGPVDQLVDQVLQEMGLARITWNAFERPFVHRRPTDEYTTFTGKYRSVLKRRKRQLGDVLGGDLRVVDRAGTPQAVEALIELEARGHKGRNGVALRTGSGEVDQFRAMADAFAAAGRLQVLSLEAGGTTAAMQFAVRGGDGLFAIKVAYDESLAKFGPGVELQLGSIAHFHANTSAGWIDSCTYDGNELLLRLYPDRRTIMTYLLGFGSTERALLNTLPRFRPVVRRMKGGRDGEKAAAGSDLTA